MTKENIQKLYRNLSADFASKPLDSVMEDCRKTIKKYYSCFPLLLNLGILMINHVELLKAPRKTASLTEEAKVLFIRIREECDDVSITRQALFMEALCSLISGDANTALELLDGSVAPALPPESLLASAYQMTGCTEEAKSVLQVGMFQNIVVLFNFFPAYLTLCADVPSKFDEVLRRLHGDTFFDRLDGWLGQLDLGTDLPRDEKTIRKSMSDVIVNNPVFLVLSDEQRFQSITEKLQHNCE